MDFEQIIADLVREQAAEADRELDEEVASLAEAELVSAQISDRLRAVECGQVKLSSAHGYSVTGSVVRANPAWVLLKGAERGGAGLHSSDSLSPRVAKDCALALIYGNTDGTDPHLAQNHAGADTRSHRFGSPHAGWCDWRCLFRPYGSGRSGHGRAVGVRVAKIAV